MAVTHFSGPVAVGSGQVTTPTGAVTLTANDNGRTIMLNAAAGFTITLPAVTNVGWRATFRTGAAFATTNFVVASAEGDNISGSVIVAGVVVVAGAEDQVNFVATAETIGDFVELYADGTNWHVFGNAAVTAAITVTDPA